MQAEKPPNEEARLAALKRYHILDTPREMAFDELTQHIAQVCQTPIALISLVDSKRQWFKSEVGLHGIKETPLQDSFCAHNIVNPGMLLVPDTLQDPRFSDNPLIHTLNLRFYGGHSLETPDGFPIGSLCVLDHRPRELSAEQQFALKTISRQVMIQLELRRLLAERNRMYEELTAQHRLQQERDFLAAVLDSAGDGIVACDQDGILQMFNRATREFHAANEQPLPPEKWAETYDLYLPDGKTRMPTEQIPLYRAWKEGRVEDVEMVIAPPGLPPRHLLASGRSVTNARGEKAGAVVVMHDITARKQTEEERLRLVEAKAAKESAEASSRRVTQVLESITDAFFLLDKDWRFTYANNQAEILLKRKREELLGRNVWEEFPQAVGTQFEKQYRRAVQEKITVRFEAYYPPLDMWFYVTAYPSSEGLSVYFTDVTDRKKTEQALEEKERRFRAVFNQQFQFMALLSPEGAVLELNDLVWNATGFEREQVMGKLFWDAPFWAHLPEEREAWKNLIAQAWSGAERGFMEVRFETASGEIRVADAVLSTVRDPEGAITFLIAEGKDITERKLAEHRLRQSEERFRMLVHQVGEYAIFMTDPDGKPTSWNEGVERILRYPQQEFIGLDPHLLYTPEDVAANVPEQELMEAAAIGSASDDRWLVRKGGDRFWASGMTSAVRDEYGKLLGFAKVFRDLTEQKRIEDQLRHAQEQLREHAQQLEQRVIERTSKLQETVSELEAFSYSVSHDLRAPLRAMQGYSQFLLDDYGDKLDESGREFVVRIRNAASRLDQLIQDVLTYSRVARGQIELKPLDLQRLIHDLVQAYPSLQRPQAEIEIKGPLLKVLAHEAFMTQCLSNLLGNAAKFVLPGIVPRIVIWSERRGEWVRVWFEDNGIGIAPEHQQRIFRMFETAHHQGYQGTGIGLAIVRKAIERMGGAVGVESELGKGSRFWIELPEGK